MSKLNQPLWDHQKKAIELSHGKNQLALFFEVGTGKSRTAIDILRHKCAANERLLRTLILVPKIVISNWQKEIADYSKIHKFDVIPLIGTGLKRTATINKEGYKNNVQIPKIFITNYETLGMESTFKALMEWGPEMIIADECHRLKNPEGKRAKKCIELSDTARYKLALTGTPILNSAMDIFNIYRFLDNGETFGTNFWKFRSIWFEDANSGWAGQPNYFPKYEPRPETYRELHNMIYKKAVRAVKSECLDLPPLVRKEIFVEMNPEQQRLYKEMRDQYVAYIDDVLKTDTPRAVVANMAVVKALRLMQIVTGYAKTDEGEIYKIKDIPRLDVLSELLEDLTPNHKVIVWSVFHENYTDIAEVCKKLKIGFVELHGKIEHKDRDKNLKAFREDPKCRVIIANQAAAGIGINLIESDVSIYYSKNFSLEQDLQSEARNYRGGSERHTSVTRIDMVSPDTIDQLISDALASKQDISKKVLDWTKEL